MNKPILSCQDLSKTFAQGDRLVQVLEGISFETYPHDSIAILGRSGSGKSTFLQLLGGLDSPSSGKVLLADEAINSLSEERRCRLRNQSLGFIYQFHHLLPEFSALENVAMPLLIEGVPPKEATARAKALLKKVGLEKRLDHRIGELSGGECQRVAIARALVNDPTAILADEPTGNLDAQTANEVFELMLQLNQELGTALVVVTHDLSLAAKMKRQFVMEGGRLSETTSTPIK